MSDDLQKLLKRIKKMVVKKGGENVTVLVTMIGGEATNQLVFLRQPPENWSKYGQVQEAFYGDPKAQALLRGGRREAATWQTYAARDARPLSLPETRWPMGCPPRYLSRRLQHSDIPSSPMLTSVQLRADPGP